MVHSNFSLEVLFLISIEKFVLQSPPIEQYDPSKQNLFLIVRSLKNEEGVQRVRT